MKINLNLCKSVKSMKMRGNLWKSMKIRENLWKSIKNLWKSMKSTNIYGKYLFRKKKMGYIVYFKNINASHICPPKRKSIVWTEKMKIKFWGEILTLTCKTRVKVTIFIKVWNDPIVITVTLPQPVWLETPIEVQFLTKVLTVIFSKNSGTQFGVYIRRFNKLSAAISMTIRSGLNKNGPRGPEIQKIMNLY